MSTWQFTTLISVCTDLFEANIAISLFISLHWWQTFKEFFTDSTTLWFALVPSKDENSLHIVLKYLWNHLERILLLVLLSYVHLNVAGIVEIYLLERLRVSLISVRKCLYMRLTHTSSIWNGNRLCVSRLLVTVVHCQIRELVRHLSLL